MKRPTDWLWLALALLVVGGSSCNSSPDKRVIQYLNTAGFGNRYSGNAEDENYLTLGDRVTYVDSYNPDLVGTEIVGIDGTIIVPEVGAVHVAGLTRTEVEALLTQKFSPYFLRNDIKVEIATSTQKIYYIVGEVSNPGIRVFPGDLTVFDAIQRERLSANRANLGRVKVVRGDPVDPLIITVNVSEIQRYGDTTFNVLIRERDIVVVPPTFLAQIGNFLGDLLAPFTSIFQTIFQSLLAIDRFNVNRQFNNSFF